MCLLHKEVHTPETTNNLSGNPYRKVAPHERVLTTMWQAGKDIDGGYKTVVSERAGQEDQEELNENQTNTKGNKGKG